VDITTELTLIGRTALGAFLGYVIGFEREFRGKPAGERTFGLLALGAAGVTALGALAFPAAADRVIAGVITGVGFLGAGLIFRERDMSGHGQVLGLTTAASSWAAAAVGILAGAGAYVSSLAACMVVLVILEVNRLPLYRRVDPSKARRDEATGGYDPRFGTTAFPAATDEPTPPQD
jgi:putative Mg2+ transporter-C (MgtC) family protein